MYYAEKLEKITLNELNEVYIHIVLLQQKRGTLRQYSKLLDSLLEFVDTLNVSF